MRQPDPSTAIQRVSLPELNKVLGWTFPVLDHGFIRIIDYMGDDSAITQAARVSYGTGTKTVQEDAGLIQYLMRHHHSTPFEMCEIKLHVKLPVFVARQWIRHRTANVNEYSARYSILDKEFYIPEPERIALQSSTNRQGSGEHTSEEIANQFIRNLSEDANELYDQYIFHTTEGEFEDKEGYTLHGMGISRELARMNLPANIYTQWYWKTDLHNLLNFIRLRGDSHAQWEIQEYAKVMESIVGTWVPHTYNAYLQYKKHVLQFSHKEQQALALMFSNEPGSIVVKTLLDLDPDSFGADFSKREWTEFQEKLKKLSAIAEELK